MIYGVKNKYNCTIKQVEVDYENLTYRVGSIRQHNDIILTRVQIEELIKMLDNSSKFTKID